MSRHRRPEALPARPTIINNRVAVAVVVLVVALVATLIVLRTLAD